MAAKRKAQPLQPPANIHYIDVGDGFALTNPQQRSVPMTLRQLSEVFGYRSPNGIKNHRKQYGLEQEARGAWTFKMDVLSTESRKTYLAALANGEYHRSGKRL